MQSPFRAIALAHGLKPLEPHAPVRVHPDEAPEPAAARLQPPPSAARKHDSAAPSAARKHGMADLGHNAYVMAERSVSATAEMAERSPQRFAWLQVLAAITAWAIVVVVAVAGDLLYGLNVSSNVLIDLPETPLTRLAQLAVLVVVASRRLPLGSTASDVMPRVRALPATGGRKT